MKDTPEYSGVGVASGQFSPRMHRVFRLVRYPLFPLDTTVERNFAWWYHWISSRGEDFNMPFTVSIFLLNQCLPLNTGPKHRHYFSKIGESKSHSLMRSGRKLSSLTKIGSFPFLRVPTHFWKFRHTSESLKRHWISVPAGLSIGIFDP